MYINASTWASASTLVTGDYCTLYLSTFFWGKLSYDWLRSHLNGGLDRFMRRRNCVPSLKLRCPFDEDIE